MPLTDLLIPGIVNAYLVFLQQISTIEWRARNDLECWNLDCTNEIRKIPSTANVPR